MKSIIISLFLIVLCGCRHVNISYWNEMIKTLEKNNYQLQVQITNKINQLDNENPRIKKFESLQKVKEEFKVLNKKIIQLFDSLEIMLVRKRGVFIYDSQKTEFYKSKGITLLTKTEDKNFEGVPVNSLDKTYPRQLFFSEHKAKQLQFLLNEASDKLIKITKDLIPEYRNKSESELKYNSISTENNINSIKESLNVELLFTDATVIESLMVLKTLKSRLLRKIIYSLDFILENIEENQSFDKCEILAKAKSEIIVQGENLEIEFILACYNSKANFKVIMDGKTLNFNDGKALVQFNTSKIGKQVKTISLEIKDKMNEVSEIINYELNYEVLP